MTTRLQREQVQLYLALLALTVTLAGCKTSTHPVAGPHRTSMYAKQMGDTDTYLLEWSVWRAHPEGHREIISAPQMLVAEGQEARIRSGPVNPRKGRHFECWGVVNEVDGRKIAKGVLEWYEDGALVRREDTEVECRTR
jgi:hypothetical protein